MHFNNISEYSRIGKENKLTCAVHEECSQYGEQVRYHCTDRDLCECLVLSKSNKHAMSHSVLSTILSASRESLIRRTRFCDLSTLYYRFIILETRRKIVKFTNKPILKSY